MKLRIRFLCVAVLLTPVAHAVGIPIPDTTQPLKVSESSNYRCGANGEGLVKQDTGEYRALKNVTCHDDHLWQGDKALTFIDMVNYAADEAYKRWLDSNPTVKNSAP